MKYVRSQLAIDKLSIIGFSINSNPVTEQVKKPVFDINSLDINFKILTNKIQKDNFKIILSLTYNIKQTPAPGYSFTIASEGVFIIENVESLAKEQVDLFLANSALPMLLGHVRTFLINVTSYLPFGKFTLPAIDLRELLNESKVKTIKAKG